MDSNFLKYVSIKDKLCIKILFRKINIIMKYKRRSHPDNEFFELLSKKKVPLNDSQVLLKNILKLK